MTKIRVIHYEPNLLFHVNNVHVGRVKLVFCNIRREEHGFGKNFIFILQNGYASPVNYIESIVQSTQKKVIDDMGMDISIHFEVYIVNNKNRGLSKFQKDLTLVIVKNRLTEVEFDIEKDFSDLGVEKADLISSLNEYIVESYMPYQNFNPISYGEDFEDNSTEYVPKSEYLREIKSNIWSEDYRDKLFKRRLRQTFISLVMNLDSENMLLLEEGKPLIEINHSMMRNRISGTKAFDRGNIDCYEEIERILDESQQI